MSVYTYGRVARISDNSYRIMWQLYCRVLTFAASVATVLYLFHLKTSLSLYEMSKVRKGICF